MSDTFDKAMGMRLSALTQQFNEAVKRELSADPQAARDFLSMATTPELTHLFLSAANPHRDFLDSGSELSAHVLAADIYATIAQRHGEGERFKQHVPDTAYAPDVQEALKKVAPGFARLCN